MNLDEDKLHIYNFVVEKFFDLKLFKLQKDIFLFHRF